MKKVFFTAILLTVAGIACLGYVVYLMFQLMKAFDVLEEEANQKEPVPSTNGKSIHYEDAKVSEGVESAA
jgi:hypothetical protein